MAGAVAGAEVPDGCAAIGKEDAGSGAKLRSGGTRMDRRGWTTSRPVVGTAGRGSTVTPKNKKDQTPRGGKESDNVLVQARGEAATDRGELNEAGRGVLDRNGKKAVMCGKVGATVGDEETRRLLGTKTREEGESEAGVATEADAGAGVATEADSADGAMRRRRARRCARMPEGSTGAGLELSGSGTVAMGGRETLRDGGMRERANVLKIFIRSHAYTVGTCLGG
jgi:hypothetical protein